jgi:hypothetical protein
MRDCVRGTPIRRRRPNVFTAVALAAALALLVSCSSGVESGSAVKTPDNVSPGGAVDVALLDVGNYPTKPSPLMGSAGTAELGAIVEGQRMANYVTGPWEADPSLIRSYANSAVVLKNAAALKFVLPEALAAPAARHDFVAGFYTSREDVDRKMLQNAVLRFPSPAAAAAAAQEFSAAAATEAVLIPSVAPAPIPGHPDTAAFSHTYEQPGKNLRWTVLRAFTARGPYVLVQLAQATDSIDTAAALIAKTLDLQGPLIDQFTPTDAAKLADLPIDPTGLLARTLPVSPDDASVNQRTVYEPRAALQFETDPPRAAILFDQTGMTHQANSATAVYEARDAHGAQGIADGFFAEVSAIGKPAAAVKQMPTSRCVDLSQGKVANFYCLATADRYIIEAQAAQLLDAQQKTAAQYAMLAAP